MQAPENTLHFGAVVGDLSGFVWVCRVCTLEEGTPPYHLEGSVPLSKFLPSLGGWRWNCGRRPSPQWGLGLKVRKLYFQNSDYKPER